MDLKNLMLVLQEEVSVGFFHNLLLCILIIAITPIRVISVTPPSILMELHCYKIESTLNHLNNIISIRESIL